MKNSEFQNDNMELETVRNCPILYCMRYRPCTETCMCWGWEFGHGWDLACRDMSYEMEALNMLFYPKYRVRIQLDQIKEKFGLFTCYYSVVRDHGKFLTSVLGNLQRIVDFCLSHDFKEKYVVDVEPYDYDDTEEMTKEDYERCSKGNMCSNVEYKVENGIYLRVSHMRNYGRRHREPTKNRMWWYLGHILERMTWKINAFFEKRCDSKTCVVESYLESRACEIVRKTEARCERTCEECGRTIGEEWSPQCQTLGWITYLCERCAKKSGKNYLMDGKTYNGGLEVKDGKKEPQSGK